MGIGTWIGLALVLLVIGALSQRAPGGDEDDYLDRARAVNPDATDLPADDLCCMDPAYQQDQVCDDTGMW